MVCYYNQYHSEDTILWIPQIVNSKDGVDFTMLFTLLVFAFSFAPTGWESRRTSDPVLSRDRGNRLQFDFG
jgi:hypothetical protein